MCSHTHYKLVIQYTSITAISNITISKIKNFNCYSLLVSSSTLSYTKDLKVKYDWINSSYFMLPRSVQKFRGETNRLRKRRRVTDAHGAPYSHNVNVTRLIFVKDTIFKAFTFTRLSTKRRDLQTPEKNSSTLVLRVFFHSFVVQVNFIAPTMARRNV